MFTFTINVTEYVRETRNYEFEVDAETEEEAYELAEGSYWEHDSEYGDCDTDEVEIDVSGGPDPDAGYDEFKEERMLARNRNDIEIGGE